MINKLLGIENIEIDDIKYTQKTITIVAKTKKKLQKCPFCSNTKVHINTYQKQKIKDLSISGKCTLLLLTKKRYKCSKCKKTFLEELDFLNKRQRVTKRLFNQILEELSDVTSFTSVARKHKISVNTVIRMFDRIEYPSTNLDGVKTLGVDEFKGNTGGEKYNLILTDIHKKRVIDILPKRHFNYLSSVFKTKARDNVKYFVSDMWKPYRDIARTYFKNATYVVDKYHWIRQIVWAFENVRKTEQKKFMAMFRKYFKRSKSLLIKKYDYLTSEQKQEVNIMLYKSDKILQAHGIKEEFFEILEFDNKIKITKNKDVIREIKNEAIKMLSRWILSVQNSDLLPFKKCANTMHKWSTGILNSLECQYSNGFTEGCNNKIKVLKRNAYGYSNFKRFRNRILHIFNKDFQKMVQ